MNQNNIADALDRLVDILIADLFEYLPYFETAARDHDDMKTGMAYGAMASIVRTLDLLGYDAKIELYSTP